MKVSKQFLYINRTDYDENVNSMIDRLVRDIEEYNQMRLNEVVYIPEEDVDKSDGEKQKA